MLENAVGVLGVPVGVACNFPVNGRDVLVPMATEEPSVVALVAVAAGATPDELPLVVARLVEDRAVRHDHADGSWPSSAQSAEEADGEPPRWGEIPHPGDHGWSADVLLA